MNYIEKRIQKDKRDKMMNTKITTKKTFSMRFRFLATLICAMFAITIVIGGLCLYEVDNYIQVQAEEFVKVTCDNEAAQINDSLRNMEKSVKIMESYLMDFFTSKSDVENPSLQEKAIESADQMFIDIVKHTSNGGAVAYYFRLDPAISDGKSGLFYSKLNGSEEFFSLEPTDISIYKKEDTEHVGWFWEPYEAGEAIWMKPYHNQNNDIWMISYVIPMYFEEKFIGVVGMDFDYVVLTDLVNDIKLYENGFAHLEMDGEIISNDVHDVEEKNNKDSEEYLRESKELVNGMTLVLSADYDDIKQIGQDITFKILLAVLILSILFTVVAVYVVKKIVDPLKKLTDAAIKLSNGDYSVDIVDSKMYEMQLLSNAFENMTARLREREELLRITANRDSLTSLRNTTAYTAWVAKFEKEMEGKIPEYGIVVFDLNNLKITNDKYGHEVGNKLIVTSAKIISEVFKRSPVFRIGGDEFVVILQNNDYENRESLFMQFDSECASTFIKEGDVKIPIHIACGVAYFDSSKDMNFAEVFKRADEAMYENKRKTKSANNTDLWRI